MFNFVMNNCYTRFFVIINPSNSPHFLMCVLQYAQDYPVIWMKLDDIDGSGNSDLPISSGTSLLLPNHRFNVDLDKTTSTYTLRIRDIQETDGAIYQCQVRRYMLQLYEGASIRLAGGIIKF